MSGFSFSWQRVGDDLPLGRTKTTDCSLVIRKVTLKDSGNYTCIIRYESSLSSFVLREEILLTVTG